MDSRYAGLSAVELKNMVLDETRKFILALQFSSPLHELEEIRERIRLMTEALSTKEKEVVIVRPVDNFPQLNKKTHLDNGEV
ncbi:MULTISPECIES: hypothetical protein [Niastella]|uniref:Uncharacterized protein n=1 Tax=Niastella soli TaxID=2821487 RepID=A0ABS3YUK1_9BACT|nr:hypothetical protein [Niastella soli]MBO9201563.1 hypothetical protein [Niastella soli]